MLTGVYFRVEVLTLKFDLPETLSLGDMDDFTIFKKNTQKFKKKNLIRLHFQIITRKIIELVVAC